MPEARLATTTFTKYILSDEEQVEGSIFTEGQLQVLQSLLADLAEEKLAIEFDPEHPLVFQQAEAYKRGQMNIVQHLIDNHTACIDLRLQQHLNDPTPN